MDHLSAPEPTTRVVTYRPKYGAKAVRYTITLHKAGCPRLRADTQTFSYDPDTDRQPGLHACQVCKPKKA
jgi:hypothetical protein